MDRSPLLFGPYAGFSTKFLKHGSYLDLFGSDRPRQHPADAGGRHGTTWTLERYLIGELLESSEERFEDLRQFFPNARPEDWTSERPDSACQIIKKDPTHGGILQFGTELVFSSDGSIAAMLGASPGASTAVWTMLQVIERSFGSSRDGRMVGEAEGDHPLVRPFLDRDTALALRLRAETAEVLRLETTTSPPDDWSGRLRRLPP